MRVAIVGCCHGNLKGIYEGIEQYSETPDIVIVCGDFQAVRDESDLASMAVPNKYRTMGDFPDYYSKGAPILTLVVGGNHEASKHMMQLPYGGWLAPNIYYLGHAGVVRFRGVSIAGLSGIWSHDDYFTPHFEKEPLTESTLHSIYHIRQEDVQKLWLLGENHVDVMVSHDWPAGIEHHGDLDDLLSKKRFLSSDIQKGQLGSPPGMSLLQHLQPDYWFSAHLHIHYEAHYQHGQAKKTHFVALDKVLPRREFIKFITIPDKADTGLELDSRWLGVLATAKNIKALKPDTKIKGHPVFTIPKFGVDQTEEFLANL